MQRSVFAFLLIHLWISLLGLNEGDGIVRDKVARNRKAFSLNVEKRSGKEYGLLKKMF